MKKYIIFFIILFLLVNIISCSGDEAKKNDTIATINDYSLSYDDFKIQLKEDLEFYNDQKLTKETRDNFLEELIRKELLIQEAKKMHLDRSDKFLKTIERYWESTLIRDLMVLKSKEIGMKTLVSEDEINDTYNSMKKADEIIPPFEQIKNHISKELIEKKKTKHLQKWINGLRKKADIKINKELLYSD